jgi:hypothetical protein
MFHPRAIVRRLAPAAACLTLLIVPAGVQAAPKTASATATGKAKIDLTSVGQPAGSGIGRKGH